MLYDAFEQTKSDLIWTVMTCCSASPHVAAYKIDTLSKFWPKEKKRVDEAVKKLKANPDAKPLILAYGKIAVWSQEGFVCKSAAAAKKNVAELKKMKKQIEPLKGSAVLSIQNSAMILDSKIDELIETMPAKVPTK